MLIPYKYPTKEEAAPILTQPPQEDIADLAPGIYIIGGKKVVVK